MFETKKCMDQEILQKQNTSTELLPKYQISSQQTLLKTTTFTRHQEVLSRQPFLFPRSLWVPDASFEGQQTAEGQESLIQERRPLNNQQPYQINKFQGVD